MDPKTVVELWYDAFKADDRESVEEHAAAYNNWIDMDGFPVKGYWGSKLYGLSSNYSEGSPHSPARTSDGNTVWLHPDGVAALFLLT